MLPLFIASSLLYGAATFAFGSEHMLDARTSESAFARAGRWILLAAATLHIGAIGMQCAQGDHPLKNIFIATSFGAMMAVFGYFGISTRDRLRALGSLMATVGLSGLVLGVVFSDVEGLGSVRVPGLASAHVGFASAGLAGFTLAAGVSGVYLAMERRLRTKVFRPTPGGMSLTALDRLQHRLVLLVTPVFTLSIVTGVLWILQVGGPQALGSRVFEIAAAALAWSASVGLLVARAVWGTRGRQSARLTLVAFVALVLVVVSYGVRS